MNTQLCGSPTKLSLLFRLQETNTVWRKVLHLANHQTVPKGYSWHSDDEQDTFSFLDKGCIRLGCTTATARERIILIISGGCIFREVGLLHFAPAYPPVLKTLEPCEVYHFPGSLLHDHAFIRQYPELLSNLVLSLGGKFGAAFSQLLEKTEPSPETMVSRYLLQLVEQFGASSFAPGLSQVDLALALGLHRSTVCRILRDLRAQGIIGTFTRNNLEILNPTQLQVLCQ